MSDVMLAHAIVEGVAPDAGSAKILHYAAARVCNGSFSALAQAVWAELELDDHDQNITCEQWTARQVSGCVVFYNLFCGAEITLHPEGKFARFNTMTGRGRTIYPDGRVEGLVFDERTCTRRDAAIKAAPYCEWELSVWRGSKPCPDIEERFRTLQPAKAAESEYAVDEETSYIGLFLVECEEVEVAY